MSATTIIVNDESPRAQYTAAGGQTVFDFPFPFFEDEDLLVYLTPNGQAGDDTADLLTLTTDYTVTGESTQSGGEITLVSGATAGDIITIERVVAVERTTDYQTSGDLLAETLNREQDTFIFIAQQLRENINRGLRFQATASQQSAIVAAGVAGRALVWDADGNITNSSSAFNDIVPDAQAAQTAAELAETNAEAAQAAAELAQDGAEQAEINTEIIYDDFDDRYLGDKSSDPALDNDGDALLTGALYFNTTVPEMRVYSGTTWLPAANIAKASQAQAEAGTDDATYMTPLKTKQQGDALIPLQLQATWNTGTDTAESRISALKLDTKILDRFNATGSAPLYACRAWVNFNGTGTVAIRSSGNVSSITDNGVGDYTVNFTTAMEDASFAATAVANTTAGTQTVRTQAKTSASYEFQVVDNSTLADVSLIDVTITR